MEEDPGSASLREVRVRRRLDYYPVDVSPAVRFYASGKIERAPRLSAEVYARAREAIGAWCLDGLVCARSTRGKRVVVLAVRKVGGEAEGPFRGEPWVVGGRWDLVTPWEQFIVAKARQELFGGRAVRMSVSGPIGNQLFATGWGRRTDGPFAMQGVTLQYCYQLTLRGVLRPAMLRPDKGHHSVVILTAEDDLASLHPYVRDVIELSGWLKGGAR